MKHGRRTTRPTGHAAVVVLAALLLAACADDPLGSGRMLFEVSLVVVSGDGQVVPSGGVESEPLVVRAEDQRGTPYSDVTVEWRVAQGSGTLSATSGATDANGQAGVTFISGSDAGETEITATASFTSDGRMAGRPIPPVSFELTVTSNSAEVNDG